MLWRLGSWHHAGQGEILTTDLRNYACKYKYCCTHHMPHILHAYSIHAPTQTTDAHCVKTTRTPCLLKKIWEGAWRRRVRGGPVLSRARWHTCLSAKHDVIVCLGRYTFVSSGEHDVSVLRFDFARSCHCAPKLYRFLHFACLSIGHTSTLKYGWMEGCGFESFF